MCPDQVWLHYLFDMFALLSAYLILSFHPVGTAVRLGISSSKNSETGMIYIGTQTRFPQSRYDHLGTGLQE